MGLLLLSCSTIAQNLVINPSFEDSLGNLTKSFASKGWLDDIKYSSVDIYSTIYPEITGYAVPNNYLGYHPTLDSSSYIGFALFSWGGDLERITGSLSSTMQKDSSYRISFFIKYPKDSFMVYSKFIEVYFSSKKPRSKYGEPFFEECFNEKCPLADLKINIEEAVTTVQWVKCQAIYKAKGNEKYFTLGLFYQNRDFFKLSKRYNKSLLDSKKQLKFLKKTELFPIYINKNHHVDLINKSYGFREDRSCAYYFIDAVSMELIHPMLVKSFVKSKFKGDIDSFFYSRLQFPETPVNKGTYGDLIVSFLINENGKLDSIRVQQMPNSQIASKVIKILQQTDGMWSPTIENGKAISFKYKLVVRYQIFSGNQKNEYNKIKEEVLRNIQASKFKIALKHINTLLSLNPYNSELYFIRSDIYKSLQQYENALVDYNTATQIQNEILAVLGFIFST